MDIPIGITFKLFMMYGLLLLDQLFIEDAGVSLWLTFCTSYSMVLFAACNI